MKPKTLRDPTYLRAVRDMPCLWTGLRASDHESVVPAHIGTAGKGIKSPDDEVLPVLQSVHLALHQKGECCIIRESAPDWLIRAAFRAYARELYREWKQDETK